MILCKVLPSQGIPGNSYRIDAGPNEVSVGDIVLAEFDDESRTKMRVTLLLMSTALAVPV